MGRERQGLGHFAAMATAVRNVRLDRSQFTSGQTGSSDTSDVNAEREFPVDAHWPRRLGPGCGVLVADPLALLRLSLPNAGWRPVPRAWRSAASSLARVPTFAGSRCEHDAPLFRSVLTVGRCRQTTEGRGLGNGAEKCDCS